MARRTWAVHGQHFTRNIQYSRRRTGCLCYPVHTNRRTCVPDTPHSLRGPKHTGHVHGTRVQRRGPPRPEPGRGVHVATLAQLLFRTRTIHLAALSLRSPVVSHQLFVGRWRQHEDPVERETPDATSRVDGPADRRVGGRIPHGIADGFCGHPRHTAGRRNTHRLRRCVARRLGEARGPISVRGPPHRILPAILRAERRRLRRGRLRPDTDGG
mmetsp:Transcript_5563/g.13942  ORF Transcript_5563/g.13942 Transcript_5563/m.13942 type:complete len:213 (-) Transcript_5563:3030-3668(-)